MVLKLETIVGTLSDAVSKLRKGTFQTSAELTKQRRTNKDLRNQWFWTANIGVYEHNEDDSLSYYIGDRTAFNAIAGRNIDDFCGQLKSRENYQLSNNQRKSLQGLVKQRHAVKVDPSDLRLKKQDSEFSYFEISTENYGFLNKFQRSVAEMVYGSEKAFDESMEMLAKNKIFTTRIYVLNPEYVKSKAEKGSAIARACWLDLFGYGFDADGGVVGGSDGALRGVPTSPKATRQKAEEDATSNYKRMYQAIITNPEEAVRHLTRKTAAGLLSIVNAFYNPGK